MKKLIALRAILFAGFVAACAAQAADLTWTNGDGLFSNGLNWNSQTNWISGTPPVAGDDTFFTNDTSYTVSFNSNSQGTLTNIFAGHAGTVTMDIGTFKWTTSDRMRIGTGATTATVYLAGGTMEVDGLAQLRIGDGTNALGKLVITNGTLMAETVTVGASAFASGTLVISGSGVMTNSVSGGTLTIGNSTAGSQLIITNGGKVFVDGQTRIGNSTGSSNNLAVFSDANSVWRNSGAIMVGQGGGCGNRLVVSNGAQLFTSGGTIGGGNNGSSFNTGIVVGVGSAWLSAGAATIVIGSSITNSYNDLLVYDGGLLSCGGTLTICNTAANSVFNSFHMGGPGAMSTGSVPTVRFASGSSLNSFVLTNAVFNGSTLSFQGTSNSVFVLANSTLNLITNLATGGGAIGAVVKIDGGTVSSGAGVLIGAGSSPGSLLIITNGGKLVSNFGAIGSGASFCTGIVTSAGSVWSNTGSDILVGTVDGDSNHLAVVNGASLFNSGSLNIGYSPTADVNSVCIGGFGSSSTVINNGSLNIGGDVGSYSNKLTVTNAVLNCSIINVGVTDATNNLLQLKDGTILVNFIRIRPTNSVLFTAGTLNSGGTTMDTLANNGRPLVVGDGTSAASFELAAGGTGFHNFNAGGLVITNNATLRGSGTLVGNVTVLGTWSPGFSVGAITTSNNLTFGSSAAVNYDLGTSSDFTAVNGNLTLNGTLNVSAAAGFGAGTYTLFTYIGTLSGNGLTIGSIPDSGFDYVVDTNTSGQVKLDVTPPPVANFSGSPTSGVVPLAVTFTDTSTGTITNRFWSFGDGSTSNTLATSVAHTYNIAGTNTVSLTVFGLNSSSTSAQSDYIVVVNPPHLTVSPASHNFGSVTIGLTNSLDFTVVNAGDLTLNGTAASASPFSVTNGASYNVAPGQTQTVTVAFGPVSAGAFTGAVTFVSDGGNSTNTVIGTGLTVGSISVTPASQNFGNLTTGTTAFVTFTVTNSGGTSVSNGAATVVGGAPFTITSGATFSVPGFGATNVTVQFAPVSEGAFTDSVAFASDNGGVATNTVIGTGTQFVVPVAGFTATPTNGFTPLAVTFTDISTGDITNRLWNFGDGTTSNTTATSLSHTYSVVPPGDVNKDGKITSADSLLINQVLAGLRASTNSVLQTNFTVRLIVEGAAGSSTNTQTSLIGMNVYTNGDVNQSGSVSSADSLAINQVLAGLRAYIIIKSLPNSRSNDVLTAVTIYGINFPTNTVTAVTIGPPVNLTLSNVVAVSREKITAIVPAGGGLGTGTVSVTATPSNSVAAFGKFINQ